MPRPLCLGCPDGTALCQFSQASPGSPARSQQARDRCALCCPELLGVALGNARKRGALKRLLAVFAASSLPVYERALALVAAAGGDVVALAAGAAPPLPADPTAAWRAAAVGFRRRPFRCCRSLRKMQTI